LKKQIAVLYKASSSFVHKEGLSMAAAATTVIKMVIIIDNKDNSNNKDYNL
jgi:hypothetical protein